MKLPEVFEKGVIGRRFENTCDESLEGLVVFGIGVDPSGMNLGFARCFFHVTLNSLDITRMLPTFIGSSGQVPIKVL